MLVVALAVAPQAVVAVVVVAAAVVLQLQYINEHGWTLPAWINYTVTSLFSSVLGEIVGTISWS